MNLKCKRLMMGVLAFSVIAGTSSVGLAKGDIDLSYTYWKPSLTANVGPAEMNGAKVDSIEARSQLGIAEENIGELRLTWSANDRDKWQVQYFDTSFHGTAVPRVKVFGYDLSAGTFNTNVSAKDLQVAWIKSMNSDPEDETKVGILYGIRNVRINADSTQIAGGTARFTKDFNVTFPTIGVVAETGLDNPISGFASLSGAYAGSRGHFYDGEVGAKAFLNESRSASLSAGYRYLKIKADKSNGDKLDTKLSGPFFTATYRF